MRLKRSLLLLLAGAAGCAAIQSAMEVEPRGELAMVLQGAQGRPGDRVDVLVAIRTGGATVAGTQSDVFFGTDVYIPANAKGRPDCSPNAAIHKNGTAFAFLPRGCRGRACNGVRALVLSLENVVPIPDGSAIYDCRVQIAPSAAPGDYRLELRRVAFSSADGRDLGTVRTEDGRVTVVGK